MGETLKPFSLDKPWIKSLIQQRQKVCKATKPCAPAKFDCNRVLRVRPQYSWRFQGLWCCRSQCFLEIWSESMDLELNDSQASEKGAFRNIVLTGNIWRGVCRETLPGPAVFEALNSSLHHGSNHTKYLNDVDLDRDVDIPTTLQCSSHFISAANSELYLKCVKWGYSVQSRRPPISTLCKVNYNLRQHEIQHAH